MNLPDPAPYATPVAQAFAHASAMVNTFGTTTTEATRALQKWQTEYLRMLELELGQPKPHLAPTPGQSPGGSGLRRCAATKAGHVTLHI